jgi:hypothetical protein
MGWVIRRPSLTALEIAWRWIFGVPFVWVCWQQGKRMLALLPPASTGLTDVDTQNPWIAAVQVADVWTRYAPHVAAVLEWLVPAAALGWVVASGIGRALILERIEPGLRRRPFSLMVLQAAWLAVLGLVLWGWFRSVQWAAATHITPAGEADLVGYSVWVIFLSLGIFTLWALISWPFAIAPMLMVLEDRSALSAFGASFRLERPFTGKLMEINLVMGIVRLALIVVTMVFSAAPLPFSDQLGGDAMHFVWAGSSLFYLVASDYFQVVRLKSFVEFWRTFRGQAHGNL